MGIRLMIIELRKYIKVGELLIENRTTESQGHIHYQDRVRRVSVTRAAVCMEKGTGMQTGHGDAYNQSPSVTSECTALLGRKLGFGGVCYE